jgi:hypothetical protein
LQQETVLFGESATQKRRAIQKAFGEAKRKTDQQYFDYLTNRLKIAPGEALKARLLGAAEEVVQDQKVPDTEVPDTDDHSTGDESNESQYQISNSRNRRKECRTVTLIQLRIAFPAIVATAMLYRPLKC